MAADTGNYISGYGTANSHTVPECVNNFLMSLQIMDIYASIPALMSWEMPSGRLLDQTARHVESGCTET